MSASGIQRRRLVLCCTQCNRAKLKCDKNIPCSRCIEKGIQEQCQRAVPRRAQRSSAPAIPPTPRTTVDEGSVTWEEPPSAIQTSSRDASPAAPSNNDSPRVASVSDGPPPRRLGSSTDAEVTDAASILEFLAWGRVKDVDHSTNNEAPTKSLSTGDVAPQDRNVSLLQTLQLLLPNWNKTVELVQYHVKYLLWYHGSFHGPTFLRQLDDFFTLHGSIVSEGCDLQWVALLFSVLVGTLASGNKNDLARMALSESEQEMLSHRWLNAVTELLNSARWMANPSIHACQAVATLTLSAHMLGRSNEISILLASALRIAQNLGLHHVDERASPSIERETGRRLWCQLCSQDWFNIPFSESYLILPRHAAAGYTLNCDDISLAPLPESEPTVTSYSRLLNSIAQLMPLLQDGIETSNTMFTKYEQVLKYDKKMRHIADQRENFFCNVPLQDDWPPWIIWARRSLAISAAHKILMIHRKFLSLSFTMDHFSFTRRTCIAASKTIIKEVKQCRDDGPVLWIYHAFAVAASITLCLDAFHRQSSDSLRVEHCDLVRDVVDILERSHNSKIAERGGHLLSDLLALLERTAGALTVPSRPRTEDSERSRRHTLLDVVQTIQRQFNTESKHARGGESQVLEVSKSGRTMPNDMDVDDDLSHARRIYAETPADGQHPYAFAHADRVLSSFHSNYLSGSDPFGNLLNLAQSSTLA